MHKCICFVDFLKKENYNVYNILKINYNWGDIVRRVLSFVIAMVIVCGVVFCVPVTASAGLLDVTKKGEMCDTSSSENQPIYWELTYNTISGEASLEISGNGYMPNGTEDSWLKTLYKSGCYITELTIKEGVKSIMNDAFNGEIYLTNVKLPSSLERIGEGAFANTGITEITIPEKVCYIDSTMFNNAIMLEYNINEKNPNYYSSNGVVYSKDGSVLVAYPCGRFVKNENQIAIIPETVSSIGNYAFFNSTAKSITIPSNIKTIGKQAFAGNMNLENLVIENGVEAIYDGAFLACSALNKVRLPKSVTYLGFNCFGYKFDIAFEGIEEILDEAGIEHEGVNADNVAYYMSLKPLEHYQIDNFVYCYSDGNFTIYAPKNSVGHKYAQRFGMKYIQSECIEPELLSAEVINGGVKLTWSKSSDATGYRVYRKNKNGSWAILKDITNVNTTSFVDKSPYQKYTNIYTVRALSNSGKSSYNKKGIYAYYLKTPSLVSAKTATNGLKLSWSAVSGAEYYNIYRKADDAVKWNYIARTKAGVMAYTDKDVESSVKYTYTVRAVNSKGISGYNSTGISQTFVTSPKISAMGNAVNGVKIKWNKISGATKYRVYRKVPGDSWQILGNVSASTLSYVDKTAKSGQVYQYTVRACNGVAWSSYYTSSKIQFLSTPKIATPKSTKNGVVLNYGKVTGAKTYRIYRKTDLNGDWIKLADVNGKITYTDKTAKKGTTYYYTVRAFNGSYKSSFLSNGVKIKDVY